MRLEIERVARKARRLAEKKEAFKRKWGVTPEQAHRLLISQEFEHEVDARLAAIDHKIEHDEPVGDLLASFYDFTNKKP